MLFGGLTAKRAYEDANQTPSQNLLSNAYEKIVFEPEMGEIVGPEQPSQYIVHFSPVCKYNRWSVRCGTIDYIDLPSTGAAADAVAQSPGTPAASSSSAKSSAKIPKESSKQAANRS